MNALILAGAAFTSATITAAWLLVHAWARHTAWASKDRPRWREHGECQGCGVLMLDGSPLPPESRAFYQSLSGTARRAGTIQGPVANVKACRGCQGLGHYWVSKVS
jgi:hypothetical protein